VNASIRRRITLEEAKAQATQPPNALIRLGELEIEAAKQHRLATRSDFLPKLSSTFLNLHFNKFMGDVITVQRPVLGTVTTIGLPLAGKDQTLVAVSAAQPITPIFKITQAVNIAKADEEIARSKAHAQATAAQSVTEKYYGLLVAQRRYAFLKANAEQMARKTAFDSGASDDPALLTVAEGLASSSLQVKQRAAELNDLLAFPQDTELELAPPEINYDDDLSLVEAVQEAQSNNPDVIAAQQNVVKAKAAAKLSKLDYIPDVALTGGYVYNGNALPLLPRDFSYIGVIGAYNLFDFGKREHTIKERNAQVAMAETAVELAKAKAAASAKQSYYEMERSRQLSELRHGASEMVRIQKVDLRTGGDSLAIQARTEAAMFDADLQYLKAMARLKECIGKR
jgi:outer membrane protein TolC